MKMENNIQITHDSKSGHHLIKDHPVLLHCNHFNIELQNTILLPEYINGFDIQYTAAAETAYYMLNGYLPSPPSDAGKALTLAGELYAAMGLGKIDFSGISANGGDVVSDASHYLLGWQIRFGTFEKEAQVFTRGYIAGALSFAFGTPFSVDVARESHTLRYTATPVEQADYFEMLDREPDTEPPIVEPDFPSYNIELPCQDITREMLKSLPRSAANGLIEAFGVYLTYLPAEYYGKIAFRFEKELDEKGGLKGLARPLLVESGHICGFNTFGGIMTSDVWKMLVQPLLNTGEDWVYGIVSVINALGWGHWHIKELKPGERLELHVYNSTEALSHRKYFGMADTSKCYTAEGAAAAIMNLIYKGDIMSEPELNKEFYNSVFRSHNAFHSQESKCVAKGDPYCVFEFTNR